MRRLTIAGCAAVSLVNLLAVSARAEDAPADNAPAVPTDAATPGSQWVGIATGWAKEPGKEPEPRGTDVLLKITKRDGEKFEGVLLLWNGERGGVIEGTIRKNGSVQFTATKAFKGTDARDVVGRLNATGRLKGEQMKIRFIVPGSRIGDIQLKRKKPKDEDVATP